MAEQGGREQGAGGQGAGSREHCVSISPVFQENVGGMTCDACKPGTFYMAEKNKYGCLECVCMGISDKCTSSDWRLETVGS